MPRQLRCVNFSVITVVKFEIEQYIFFLENMNQDWKTNSGISMDLNVLTSFQNLDQYGNMNQ